MRTGENPPCLTCDDGFSSGFSPVLKIILTRFSCLGSRPCQCEPVETFQLLTGCLNRTIPDSHPILTGSHAADLRRWPVS